MRVCKQLCLKHLNSGCTESIVHYWGIFERYVPSYFSHFYQFIRAQSVPAQMSVSCSLEAKFHTHG